MTNHETHCCRRTSLRITAAAAFLLASGSFTQVEAASIIYDQPAGNWNQAENWQGGTPRRVPTVGDTAFIRADRVVMVDTDVLTVDNVYLGANSAGGSVIFNAGARLTVAGGFEVMRQGTFSNISGNLTMNGGTLDVDGALFVGAGSAGTTGTSSGTATFSGGTFTGSATVGGSVVGSSIGNFNVIGSAAAISGSVLTVNTLGRMNFTFGASGVSMLNYAAGAASFASGSTFAIDGSLYAGAGGDITLVDSTDLTWGVETDDVTITGFNGFTTQLITSDNDDVVLRLTAVPEPSAALLLLCAGVPMLAWRHRRRA